MDGDSNAPNAGPQQEAQAQAQGQQQTQPAPQPPTQMQQYALGAAGPSWAHQVYPPPLWGGYPAMPCNPSFSYPMMNGGQSNTNMMLPIPAFPMGAVPVGKPRGRPPGSKNKKKVKVSPSSDDEDEDTPSTSKRRKSEAEAAATTVEEVAVPERTEADSIIPEADSDCCARCCLWHGYYVCYPCGHYGFCQRCLNDEKHLASQQKRSPQCQSCHAAISKYVKSIRHSPDPFFDEV